VREGRLDLSFLDPLGGLVHGGDGLVGAGALVLLREQVELPVDHRFDLASRVGSLVAGLCGDRLEVVQIEDPHRGQRGGRRCDIARLPEIDDHLFTCLPLEMLGFEYRLSRRSP